MLNKMNHTIKFVRIMNENENAINSFAKRIRKLRAEQKISQEELAYRAGLHRTYIGMIERGEKNITLRNIEKIANALHVNIKDLF